MTFSFARWVSIVLLTAACPWFAAQAAAAEAVDWYGTIRFSKKHSERATETFPVGHVYAPGTEVNTKDVTWSGSARFLPGRKMVVTASFHRHQLRDRRTDRLNTCPWKDEKTAYHDYELSDAVTTVSVNKQWDNNHLTFRIKDDGTYRTSFIVSGGNQVPKALRLHARREFFTECSIPYLDVNDQENYSSDGMESIGIDHIEGKAKADAQTLSGNWTGKDDDGGELTYSWDLTRAEPVLVARIQATPSPLQRADKVTLSASASTGPISRYEWEFTPSGEGCLFTPEGAAVRLTGVSVTFTALCDFTAQLKVSNAQNSDSTLQQILVAPRRGKAWTTKFNSVPPGSDFNANMYPDQLHFGMNRCRQHGSDPSPDHSIHTNAVDNSTWREGGYVLAQVQDAGPFQGAWYVQSATLLIDRVERINAELLPKSNTYQINQGNNNLRDIQALAEQARAHEAAHSVLVKEKLKQLGPDGDPAVRIEKLVGPAGEEKFQKLVDGQVRDVESALYEANSDEQVKNRLRSQGFAREVSLWVLKRLPEAGIFQKKLGQLWGIGHEL